MSGRVLLIGEPDLDRERPPPVLFQDRDRLIATYQFYQNKRGRGCVMGHSLAQRKPQILLSFR